MDRDVRWFRREIALKVVQRLVLEVGIVFALVVTALFFAGIDVWLVLFAVTVSGPAFVMLRVTLSCAVNPTSSSYLVRWPRPSGPLTPAEPTNAGASIDVALQAAGFFPRGAFSEWGGATTNLYDDAARRIAVTSGADDLIVLTGLSTDRLCVTTTQLIPPHERLIVGHEPRGDVADVLSSHDALLETLASRSVGSPVHANPHFVIELLGIEWDIWDQIGPLVGPFVAVGVRPQPSLLRVRVPAADIRSRGLIAGPPMLPQAAPIRALDRALDPALDPAEDLEPLTTNLVTTSTARSETPARATPTAPNRGLSSLAEQARIAADRTDRALAAGDQHDSNRVPSDMTSAQPMPRAS